MRETSKDESVPAPAEAAVVPTPLKVAAGIVVLQSLWMIGLTVAELVNLNSARLEMGTTTAFFFGAAGVGLLACAWGLLHLRTWGRGPVLLAQLVQLGLAWNLRDGDFVWVAVLMAVVALVALGCLVHKQSISALEGREI
ncbi:MAG: hypothetical protein ACI379_13215 [Nocardioides sp.]|uniref:hypothetical protein n=1 Tax=Nocardioides sp. TaxID=35761 RepID=UPI003F0D9C76